jgi:chorismate synthase
LSIFGHMAGNSFGNLLRLTTFGESHGPAVGGILDGFPAGVKLDLTAVQHQLNRRKPGQSSITTPRKEEDTLEILSGIFEGTTTGAPIAFLVRNKNQHPSDYDHLKDVYRPSHADYTYQQKYGLRDHRGSGRASARETLARVAAGAIAIQMLPEVKITAAVTSVGQIDLTENAVWNHETDIDGNIVRCPDWAVANQMIQAIEHARAEGDSLGGVITCKVENVPIGLGQPVFHKLHADLAHAMMGINAVKGFELGSGFSGARMKGSEHNDAFLARGGTKTNHSGGVQGGISNGEAIVFRVAFKPVSTIQKEQETIDVKGNETKLSAHGRHDPCVVPRAVPIVEAMSSLVLADHWLWNRTSKI